MSFPKISVITINYNNAHGLEQTMESVLSQTYQSLEYIVIDGGSDDGSKDIIQSREEKLAYWVSEQDKGIYQAMNKGIKKATGDYLLFLNSGDVLDSPFVLEKAVAYSLDTDIVYGNLRLTSEKKSKIQKYPKKLQFYYFFHKGHIPHPATFIRRSLFEKIGLYREDYRIVSDWEFFVRALFLHKATYRHIDLILTNYDTNGISSDSAFRKQLLQEKEECLQENFPGFMVDMRRLQEYDAKWKTAGYERIARLKKNDRANKLLTLGVSIIEKLQLVNRFLKGQKGKLKKGAQSFEGSKNYWESRYTEEGTSGAGSYGRLAEYKAQFLNDFVKKHDIKSVIELGSGDGNQLDMATYPNYIGLDVSETAVAMGKVRFAKDPTKTFLLMDQHTFSEPCELAMSLDVIYHLTEDTVFEDYMKKLFSSGSRYVIIYASNHEERIAPHVRSRKFTQWIDNHMSDSGWELDRFVTNPYPFDEKNPHQTSISDFYIYKYNDKPKN